MSFSRLSHKLSQLQAKVGDKVYSALYYGLMPTIIVVGKCASHSRITEEAQK